MLQRRLAIKSELVIHFHDFCTAGGSKNSDRDGGDWKTKAESKDEGIAISASPVALACLVCAEFLRPAKAARVAKCFGSTRALGKAHNQFLHIQRCARGEPCATLASPYGRKSDKHVALAH